MRFIRKPPIYSRDCENTKTIIENSLNTLKLGLELLWNSYSRTTSDVVDHHEELAKVFNMLERVENILMDLDRKKHRSNK